MSTTPTVEAPASSAPASNEPASRASAATLLICLPSITAEDLRTVRQHVAAALPGETVLFAAPGGAGANSSEEATVLDYAGESLSDGGWALTAGDYLSASQLAQQHHVTGTLVLGAEAASLTVAAIQALANAVLRNNADLVLPRYATSPHDALVSSALLYPLTRALFRIPAHLPLPLDVGFSSRMAQRFATTARRPGAGTDTQPLLWPASEASVASYAVQEIEAGERTLPHPSATDLNTLLVEVTGSLFADIEMKATFWQRAGVAASPKNFAATTPPELADGDIEELRGMVDGFRNAYTNLQEIWSLVLPPQSLLGLKRVSRMSAEAFEVPADLWARTVYDFVLAYHARTINRGHLLGSLTPLYLAWVASHLRRSANDNALSAAHIEETASAFVTEKAYLVSRWRWPDRFNP